MGNSVDGEFNVYEDPEDIMKGDDETPQWKHGDVLTQDQLREILKKWIMKKYRIKMLNGVKIFLEDSI